MRVEPCPGHQHRLLAPPGGVWALPSVGDTVSYRAVCGGPLIDVVVVNVAMDDQADVNVWHSGALVTHPNPVVQLAAPGSDLTVLCRQIRWSGSPGYCLQGMDN